MFRDRFDLPAVAALPDVVSFPPCSSISSAMDPVSASWRSSRSPRGSAAISAPTRLLVVRAPNESGYQLQEGDVLMGIDGRVPESPGHAFRILRSYQPGEKLELDVLRSRKRMEVKCHGAARPTDAWRHAPAAAGYAADARVTHAAAGQRRAGLIASIRISFHAALLACAARCCAASSYLPTS